MSNLAERIQKLMDARDKLQDKKRSLEVEINYKKKLLEESKASLSEKGVDYNTVDELKAEIKEKQERLEDIVSNMEKSLQSAQSIEKPVDKEVKNPSLTIDNSTFDELNI